MSSKQKQKRRKIIINSIAIVIILIIIGLIAIGSAKIIYTSMETASMKKEIIDVKYAKNIDEGEKAIRIAKIQADRLGLIMNSPINKFYGGCSSLGQTILFVLSSSCLILEIGLVGKYISLVVEYLRRGGNSRKSHRPIKEETC